MFSFLPLSFPTLTLTLRLLSPLIASFPSPFFIPLSPSHPSFLPPLLPPPCIPLSPILLLSSIHSPSVPPLPLLLPFLSLLFLPEKAVWCAPLVSSAENELECNQCFRSQRISPKFQQIKLIHISTITNMPYNFLFILPLDYFSTR